ncbi:MAG: RebB family R body protein [Proteobacteria bacterium]|nr:RebB family R body protein [Pseudomonadota bacterium]
MGKHNAVNTQITDSVIETLESTVGSGPSHSMAVLESVMAETLGMQMHNAVTTQHNAKLVSQASLAQSCARILAAQGSPPMASPSSPQAVTVPKGPKGDMGPQGLQGPTGSVGAQGVVGAQGPQGPKGASGSPGQETITVVSELVPDNIPTPPEARVIEVPGKDIDPR